MVQRATEIEGALSGLRRALEDSPSVLPTTPTWVQTEPNEFDDFGGEYSRESRRPISEDRQMRKGVIVDLDTMVGYNEDLTYDAMQDPFQDFLYAALRTKDELAVTVVDSSGDAFQPASGGGGYEADDLLFAKGFDDASNNGVHLVSGTPGATNVGVTSTLTAATGQDGTISRVGYQFDTGELTVDVSGDLPKLVSSGRDCTTFGLIPGEPIYIGGDQTAEAFANAENNGWARVRSVDTTYIELDKTTFTMVTDSGTGKTIRIFLARVLKNEASRSLILKRTHQFERLLGAPDNDAPSSIQSEYILGCRASELTLNIPKTEKITIDYSYMGQDVETRSASTGVKSGNRPTLSDSEAYNASLDVKLVRLMEVDDTDPAPTALFAFVDELTIQLTNNLTANKAVSRLGAFSHTFGQFEMTGEANAFFVDVASLAAIRNNSDLTLEVHMSRANQGISFDFPLVGLGDGRPEVANDEPIMVPLELEFATGKKVDTTLNHTIMIGFFDYLPTAAAAKIDLV